MNIYLSRTTSVEKSDRTKRFSTDLIPEQRRFLDIYNKYNTAEEISKKLSMGENAVKREHYEWLLMDHVSGGISAKKRFIPQPKMDRPKIENIAGFNGWVGNMNTNVYRIEMHIEANQGNWRYDDTLRLLKSITVD